MIDDTGFPYRNYVFLGFFIIVSLLAFLIVRPFLGSIIAGLFVCYILYPVYRRLDSAVKNPNVSSVLMTLAVSLIILVPIALLSQVVISEVLRVHDKFSLEALVALASNYFTPEMQELIATLARQVLTFLVSLISTFVLSIPQKIISAFVFIMTVFVTFRSGDKLVADLKAIIPLRGSDRKEIINRFMHTTDAIIYGVVVVSLLQGIAALVGFYIFGVPSPALWAFITFIAALLPIVGPAIVWVPLVIAKYISGDISAVIGLAIYSIVVQNILLDIGLKTKIIGVKGRIPPLLVLLGIIGGVVLFGITGILLGPIVLVTFVELLRMYVGKNAFAC